MPKDMTQERMLQSLNAEEAAAKFCIHNAGNLRPSVLPGKSITFQIHRSGDCYVSRWWLGFSMHDISLGCAMLQFEDVRLKVEIKANSSWLPSEWGGIASCFMPKKRQEKEKQVNWEGEGPHAVLGEGKAGRVLCCVRQSRHCLYPVP